METKIYHKGDIIFRQGDSAASMYDIRWGRVGIYVGYGTDEEKKLAELDADTCFGEMGMIDHAPRSATAVALENRTCLAEITEEQLGELFRERPAKVLTIMQQLSSRLRGLTRDYMEACRTADGITRLEEKKEEKEEISDEAVEEINARAEYYSRIRLHGHDIYL